jgi:hypothetical protein
LGLARKPQRNVATTAIPPNTVRNTNVFTLGAARVL